MQSHSRSIMLRKKHRRRKSLTWKIRPLVVTVSCSRTSSVCRSRVSHNNNCPQRRCESSWLKTLFQTQSASKAPAITQLAQKITIKSNKLAQNSHIKATSKKAQVLSSQKLHIMQNIRTRSSKHLKLIRSHHSAEASTARKIPHLNSKIPVRTSQLTETQKFW